MNEVLLYGAIGIGIMFIASKIPGVDLIAQAVLKLAMDFIVEIVKRKGTFVVWLFKTLISDHVLVIKHATQSQYDLDPTQRVRQESKSP